MRQGKELQVSGRVDRPDARVDKITIYDLGREDSISLTGVMVKFDSSTPDTTNETESLVIS